MSNLSPLTLSLALLFILTGCRTYGGHDSEAATFRQLKTATQTFKQDYERASARAAVLKRSAGRDTAAAALAEKYQALVELHGKRLAQQRVQLEELRDSDDYRALSRALGGFVKEQQVMDKEYRTLLARYRPDGDTTGVKGAVVPLRSRYRSVPPFYERARGPSKPRLPSLARNERSDTTRQMASPAAPDTTTAP